MLRFNLKHTRRDSFPLHKHSSLRAWHRLRALRAKKPSGFPLSSSLISSALQPLSLLLLSPEITSSQRCCLLGATITHHTHSFTLHSAQRNSTAGLATSCETTATVSSSSVLPITAVSGQVLFWGDHCTASLSWGLYNPQHMASTAAALVLGPGTPGDRNQCSEKLQQHLKALRLREVSQLISGLSKSQKEQFLSGQAINPSDPWLPQALPGTALALQKARGKTHPDLHNAQVLLTLFTCRCFRESS